jgi:hypothetical protein
MTTCALIEVQCDGADDILEIACVGQKWCLSGNQPERLIGMFDTPNDIVDFMNSRDGSMLFKNQVWHYYEQPFLPDTKIGKHAPTEDK